MTRMTGVTRMTTTTTCYKGVSDSVAVPCQQIAALLALPRGVAVGMNNPSRLFCYQIAFLQVLLSVEVSAPGLEHHQSF
jgi:hypothetical protein